MPLRVLKKAQSIVLIALGFHSLNASALEWNGQSFFSDDWTDSGNWTLCGFGCDGPESDQTADFGALGIRTTPYVDEASSVKGLKFEVGARLYTISGSELTIGSSGIKNWTTKDQVIKNNIKLSANQGWGQVLPSSLVESNGELQIGGRVNLNGKSLTIGTPVLVDSFGFRTPRTSVRLSDGFSGNGNIYSDGAILTGESNFSGNVYLRTGSAMRVTGSSGKIRGTSGATPDIRFLGDTPILQRRFGVFRVDDNASATVDKVTAQNDYLGKVFIGGGSEVYVGRDDSDFTMNVLIQGEGVHNNSRLFKDGNGETTINTYSFDADTYLGAGGVKTIVRDGTLVLTGEHAGNHWFETQSGGQLNLDVARDQTATFKHEIYGDGIVAKSGRGTGILDSNLAFTGEFHMDEGRLNLARDNLFSGENVLRLNDGILDLNGKKAAFTRVIPGFGDIDFNGGELTIGKLNESHGNSTLRVIDHLGSGTLVKTGLDAMDFTFQYGFNGKVEVDQGTLNLYGNSAGIDLEMNGGRLEQSSSNQRFKNVTTTVGSILDLNGTNTTLGRLDVDAGVESRISGELLGNTLSRIVKNGFEDLILEDADNFSGTLLILQGKTVMEDTVLSSDGTIDIRTEGELAIGSGVSAVFDNAIIGDGSIIKDQLTSNTITNATGFNGQITINRGVLSTGTSTSLGDQVDVHVVKGSFGGGGFGVLIENQLDVNSTQGFGSITGDGIVDFTHGSVSVGNGDKSSTFDGSFRSQSFSSLEKKGSGKVILNGDQDYRGTTYVRQGELQINGILSDSTSSSIGRVVIDEGATLSGRGRVGQVSGAGTLSPGNSPGIMSVHSINPTQGLDFVFEFTSDVPNYGASLNSLNDVVRMTDFSSIVAPLTEENEISIFIDFAIEDGDTLEGGFFSRRVLFANVFENADISFFVIDAEGAEQHDGSSYSLLDMALWDVEIGYLFRNVFFDGDSSFTGGYATTFTFTENNPVPVPATIWLFLSALFPLLGRKSFIKH